MSEQIPVEELTPMMQQYLETKKQYADCILFYRLGDFYEMFFEDAKTVSKELELTLTGKACGLEERAPMCGVPYHAVEGYLTKLVNKGYKVAICEQVEDPKLAKGLVKREVLRIVTPGTNLNMQSLEESRNNFLMCIAYTPTKIGISVAYELSPLPAEVQEKAAEDWQGKRGPVTLEDVRRWKEQTAKPAEDERTYKPGVYVREEKTNLINPAVPEQTGGVTMVMADEIGPAPTAEQWEELKESAGAAKNAGKIVNFPAPPSPPPAEDVPKPEKEPMYARQAANILEDLQMYCEEMLAIEAGLADTWAERADALAVAIATLRK